MGEQNQGATAGLRPLLTFSGALFDIHPRYQQFKSLMIDSFHGQTVETMELDGLQYVISLAVAEQEQQSLESSKEDLPPVHFRVYILRSKKVKGSKFPRVELEEMGPRMDLKLGRYKDANPETLALALKKPKGKEVKPRPPTSPTPPPLPLILLFLTNLVQIKMKKNVEIDIIGDKVGRIHVGTQDFGKLQTRKMRGLKRRAGDDENGVSKRSKTSRQADDESD